MSEMRLIACSHCHTLNRIAEARLGDAPRCGYCHRPLFNAHPMVLDTAHFDLHAARSELPLLVDFWAPWCGPCRAMAPHFENAARQLEPRIRLAKVDTEAEPALASRFAIRSIPTLALFVAGREVARQAGAQTATEVVAWTDTQLRASKITR